jgi:hypothetical protein
MPRALEVNWLHQVQHMLVGGRVSQHSPKQRPLDPDRETIRPAATGRRYQILISKRVHPQHSTPSDLNKMM